MNYLLVKNCGIIKRTSNRAYDEKARPNVNNNPSPEHTNDDTSGEAFIWNIMAK